jgi:hypothetical protein
MPDVSPDLQDPRVHESVEEPVQVLAVGPTSSTLKMSFLLRVQGRDGIGLADTASQANIVSELFTAGLNLPMEPIPPAISLKVAGGHTAEALGVVRVSFQETGQVGGSLVH